MKQFRFNNQDYDLYKLIILNNDINALEYHQGKVLDIEHNQEYDINDLTEQYRIKVIELLNNNILDETTHKTLSKIYNKKEKEIKFYELSTKIENNSISLIEFEQFIKLISKKHSGDFNTPKYDNFVIVNIDAKKPQEINHTDYCNFLYIAQNIDYFNRLAYINNGKPISKDDLTAMLDFKNIRILNRYLQRIEKCNLIKKIKLNNIAYIMVNPHYITRHGNISPLLYYVFGNEIKEHITVYEQKYLQLLLQTYQNVNTINIV